MQSNSFKSQSNFPFSSSPLTYTDYYKFKATTTIYLSKPVQCAHSIDAFSLTPSNPPSYMGIDLQDNMKVRQQFTRGIWDHHHNHIHTNHNNNNKQHCNNFITSSSTTTTSSIDQCDPSLSLGRMHPKNPIAPPGSRRAVVTATHDRPITSFDLKSFIRPESGPRKLSPSSSFTHDKDIKQSPSPPHQVETHPGGTRWNPTQDQIGILETLYKQGMRTPNAQQIEQITTKLSKYGKIEGKNVFYWFQNHKARERQKQKRNILGFSHMPSRNTLVPPTPNVESRTDQLELQTPTKRKCGTWSFDFIVEENGLTSPISWTAHEYVENGGEIKTLELFPLHPETKPDES